MTDTAHCRIRSVLWVTNEDVVPVVATFTAPRDSNRGVLNSTTSFTQASVATVPATKTLAGSSGGNWLTTSTATPTPTTFTMTKGKCGVSFYLRTHTPFPEVPGYELAVFQTLQQQKEDERGEGDDHRHVVLHSLADIFQHVLPYPLCRHIYTCPLLLVLLGQEKGATADQEDDMVSHQGVSGDKMDRPRDLREDVSGLVPVTTPMSMLQRMLRQWPSASFMVRAKQARYQADLREHSHHNLTATSQRKGPTTPSLHVATTTSTGKDHMQQDKSHAQGDRAKSLRKIRTDSNTDDGHGEDALADDAKSRRRDGNGAAGGKRATLNAVQPKPPEDESILYLPSGVADDDDANDAHNDDDDENDIGGGGGGDDDDAEVAIAHHTNRGENEDVTYSQSSNGSVDDDDDDESEGSESEGGESDLSEKDVDDDDDDGGDGDGDGDDDGSGLDDEADLGMDNDDDDADEALLGDDMGDENGDGEEADMGGEGDDDDIALMLDDDGGDDLFDAADGHHHGGGDDDDDDDGGGSGGGGSGCRPTKRRRNAGRAPW